MDIRTNRLSVKKKELLGRIESLKVEIIRLCDTTDLKRDLLTGAYSKYEISLSTT